MFSFIVSSSIFFLWQTITHVFPFYLCFRIIFFVIAPFFFFFFFLFKFMFCYLFPFLHASHYKEAKKQRKKKSLPGEQYLLRINFCRFMLYSFYYYYYYYYYVYTFFFLKHIRRSKNEKPTRGFAFCIFLLVFNFLIWKNWTKKWSSSIKNRESTVTF